MMQHIAGFLVFAFALLLTGLSLAVYARPSAARRFLNLFASSARSHYLEQLLRLVAGGAVVLSSPSMQYPMFLNFSAGIL